MHLSVSSTKISNFNLHHVLHCISFLAALPEFVPFNDEAMSSRSNQSDNHSTNNQRSDTKSPAGSRPGSKRDRDSRTPERQRDQYSQNNYRRSHGRSPPRESQRTIPIKHYSPISYNDQRHDQRRNRSRSPRSQQREFHGDFRRTHDESRRQERESVNYQRIEFHRNNDRLSSERQRQNGLSIFQRMANPPVIRRRFNESGSRHSMESNGNGGSLSQIVRTVSNRYEPIEPHYHHSTELALDMIPHQRQRSPPIEQIRYVEQLMVESNHIPDVATSSRSVLLDDSVELEELRRSITEAEAHYFGLERTFGLLERELSKLHQIIVNLKEKFNIVSSQMRR